MENLNRLPTKSERVLSVVLTALSSFLFGGIAVFGLNSNPVLIPTVIIFSLLFLISITLFFRATFTPSRTLTENEKLGFARVQVIGGLVGALLSFFLLGSVTHRLLILGSSLTCIGYGLATLTRRNR